MEDFGEELLLFDLDDSSLNGLELDDLISPASDDDTPMCRPGGSGSLQDASLCLPPEPGNYDFDQATCGSTGTGLFYPEETSLPSPHLEMDGAKRLDEPMEDRVFVQVTSHDLQVLGRGAGVGFGGPGAHAECHEKLQTGSIHVNQAAAAAGKATNTAKGKPKKPRRQRPASDEERRERRKECNRRASDKRRKKVKEETEAIQKDYLRVLKELEAYRQLWRHHCSICPLQGFTGPNNSP